MSQMINVGGKSFIMLSQIEAIVPPESAPLKRLVSEAKDKGLCIDLTYGKRTKSVIFTKQGRIYLSATLPDTLSNKAGNKSSDKKGSEG